MYDFDKVYDRSGTFSLKWDECKPGELPMWVADMEFRTAPEIISALEKRAAHGIFGYTEIPDEWYDAYIGWWKRRHGIKYARSELIFSTGVIPIISSCVRKLTTPAENVVILTPVYNVFFNCIRNNGRNVIECPLSYENGRYDIDFDRLEKVLSDPQTSMLLFCNPHNPTGRIWRREELARVGELCVKYNVTVICDEIHCDITDPGVDYMPFASVSEECAMNSVICVSPTKTFNLAGLQTAAAIVKEPRLRHKVWRALNTDEVAEPNAFAVQAAVAAFTEGEDWLNELRKYIYYNKQMVKAFLETELPEIKLVSSQATYLLWLDCSQITEDSKSLAGDIRRSSGLFLSNGVQYGRGGERFLRMNIACPTALVSDGLLRLEKSLKK